MHRDHKVKDARRRARKLAQRMAHEGTVSTATRFVPDKRKKAPKHVKSLREEY